MRPTRNASAPYVLDPAAHLAEPVRFEVLRAARPEEAWLLVAAVALHHNAELVTFDAIASVSVLRLNRLSRPV